MGIPSGMIFFDYDLERVGGISKYSKFNNQISRLVVDLNKHKFQRFTDKFNIFVFDLFFLISILCFIRGIEMNVLLTKCVILWEKWWMILFRGD